ncbi:uncharacterized protein LOC135335190 isoform X6 [Halichondria panicea]|uniref:uncharacterized protein LOC135335190 isoform X6 n=1 Tax=Halichondria panicea TaxID=6063 RepID=UPI00312BCBD8
MNQVQGFYSTKHLLEDQLLQANESVERLSAEKEFFLQEQNILKKEIVDLHDKLEIVRAKAELYKEDFENERKDRENAHDLKEEMRRSCDQRVHAIAKERHALEETIQNLLRTRIPEELSNDKEGLQEVSATRTSTRQHELQQNNKEIHELQEQLYEARQKAITAQEEVQAKTAQVKQYKKKDDQRDEKLVNLEARNQGLMQEMERVRSELKETKTEYMKLLEKQKKSSLTEMGQICHDLRKKTRKKIMSKSEAHIELLEVQLDNDSLRVHNERLNESLQQVQVQFARLKVQHLELKKEVTKSAATPTTPTEPSTPIQAKNPGLVQETDTVRIELDMARTELLYVNLPENVRKSSRNASQKKVEHQCESSEVILNEEITPTTHTTHPSGSTDHERSLLTKQNTDIPRSSGMTMHPQISSWQPQYQHPPIYIPGSSSSNAPDTQRQRIFNSAPDSQNTYISSSACYDLDYRDQNHVWQQERRQIQPYVQHQEGTVQPLPLQRPPQSSREACQLGSQHRREPLQYHQPNRGLPKPFDRTTSQTGNATHDSSVSSNYNSVSDMVGPNSNPSYMATDLAVDLQREKPKPKPRHKSQQREENELEKSLDKEIQEIVNDLFYEQYESEKQRTNEHVPLDSNLVCLVCSKQHRLGEIQKYRKHVKECEREQGVRAVEAHCMFLGPLVCLRKSLDRVCWRFQRTAGE